MREPDFVRHQREILRIFRNATARHRAERHAADAKLEQVQQKANTQLATVREMQEKAQAALAEVGLHHLFEDTLPSPPTSRAGADPAQELAHSASVATEAATAIPDVVDALRRQREATASRLRWLTAFAAGVVLLFTVILTVVGFQGYRSWQTEQRRRQANAAATAEALITATAVIQAQATATSEAQLIAAAVASGLQQLRDDFELDSVYVPPGEFTMGSPQGEGDSDEHPQHTVYLDGFWIGLTEVTNAQYRPFIKAGGYQQQELWTGAGWEWRQSEGITQPRYWDDEEWNQPDYPLVGVSWYEAVAYTHWLSQETGLEVRLPTEAEWEKAARGTDGRQYPWGDLWDESKANTDEGGIGQTAPVGGYPTGASPYGALDMAGNVWEWTSSLYQEYPYRADDGRENLEVAGLRVMRGGSWNNYQWDARSANRDVNLPSLSNNILGLRLLVAAH